MRLNSSQRLHDEFRGFHADEFLVEAAVRIREAIVVDEKGLERV